MIKIFDAADRDFSSGGNIIIEPTKCLEYKKKSLNGWYIEVELPIKYKDYIEEDKLCVIQTKSKLNPQAFRINQDLKKTNRKITFTANHVMFDMEKYFLLDVRPTNLNGLNALNYINQRTDNVSPFSFYSDVETMSTAYFIRKNMLEACETIEERWGGVFDADNWNINFLQSVGHDNGETIIYGKNMQDMEIYEDWSAVVTRLYPVGYDGIMLPEKSLESRISYDVPYTRTIDFQTDLEEEERTEENLIQELREKGRKYITENQYPKVSYTTKSDINNDMEIGDTIQVKHPLVTITTEVLEYVYNVISKKIKELTFGNYSRDVKTKFNNIKNTIKSITREVSNQQIVINQQTELINSLNKNGFVYIDDNEILILDRLPKEEAVNVWRWGLGGLGFSSNGYEGPFETAITMDGQINAKFITTGMLSVSRIEGLANTLNEYSKSIAAINIELGRIESSISDIADITTSKESNEGYLTFENINQSEPINIEIRPLGDNISYLYPFEQLYPANELFIKLRKLRFTNTTTNEVFNYELPDDLLYYDSENYDSFVLDYNNEDCYIVKKCGYNSDGEVILLSEERIETVSYPSIKLTDGNYSVEVLKYDNTPYICYLMVRLMLQNVYTTQFPTRAEMNSIINQTATSITTMVSETYERRDIAEKTYSQLQQTASSISATVENNNTRANIVAKINGNTSSTIIEADNISLAGKRIDLTSQDITISSNNFSVDTNGNMKCSNANVSGTISSSDASITGGSIKLQGVADTITEMRSDGITLKAGNKELSLFFAQDPNNQYVPIIQADDNSNVKFSLSNDLIYFDDDVPLEIRGNVTIRKKLEVKGDIQGEGIVQIGDCRLNGINGNVTVGNSLYVDESAIRSQYTYNDDTVSNSPNVYITSGGWFRRTTNTSSERYKTDIKNVEEVELKPEKLYDLPVRQFKYKTDYLKTENDPRYDKVLIGFIAEEVAKYYPIAVDYEIDEEGNKYIENWNEKYIIPAMLKLIQGQHKEIEQMKIKIEELEKRLEEK